MLAAPGVNPIVTAGVWLPPPIGLATGASRGTVGGLFSPVITGDVALHERQEVHADGALVSVTTSKPPSWRTILKQTSTLEIAGLATSRSGKIVAGRNPDARTFLPAPIWLAYTSYAQPGGSLAGKES